MKRLRYIALARLSLGKLLIIRNKRKFNCALLLVVLTLLFVACEQGEFNPIAQGDPNAVKINVFIGEMKTRVVYGENGETGFIVNDQIRVVNYTRVGRNKSDAVYKIDGYCNWLPVDNNNYLVWDGFGVNTFYGSYPATASYVEFVLPTDQSAGIASADWMTDDYEGVKSDSIVSFVFEHRLAKITLKVEWNTQYANTKQEITGVNIYSKGSQFTAVYGIDGVSIVAHDGFVAIEPWQNADASEFTAIVAPMVYSTMDKLMTFVVNGTDSLTVLANNLTLNGGLKAGCHYTFSLIVGKEAVDIADVNIIRWEELIVDGVETEEVNTIVSGGG